MMSKHVETLARDEGRRLKDPTSLSFYRDLEDSVLVELKVTDSNPSSRSSSNMGGPKFRIQSAIDE